MEDLKIVSIIPARGGSKGIPRKNLKLLADKPLVAYSIEASLKSKYVNRTFVSTEDAEIKEVGLKFGAEIIDRPIELAQDETKTAPVVLQAVDKLIHSGYQPDIVVMLQPTSPLRGTDQIDGAIELLLNSPDNDSVFAGMDLGFSHGLWVQKPKEKYIESVYNYHLRPRRQENDLHTRLFRETGSMYAIRTEALYKTRDFVGDYPCIYFIKEQDDIDTPEDFERTEKALSNK